MRDGCDTVVVEGVVDIARQVVANGLGRKSDARGPFGDESIDVAKTVIAGLSEVGDKIGRRDGRGGERFGSHRPDGGYPQKAGACAPLLREVEPEAWTGSGFDAVAVFESEKCRVADEQCGVCSGEHGDGVGRGLDEFRSWLRSGVKEFAEEELRVDERTARGGVGGDGADGAEGGVDEREVGVCATPRLRIETCGTQIIHLHDELDGADAVERGDGAARHNGEFWRERGDWDQAEVGTPGEKLVSAECRRGRVDLVALDEGRSARRVVEVPHERRRIEETDGGDAEPG